MSSYDKFTRQTLLEVQTLTPSLFTLRTTRDAGFRFRAGQFVRLGVEKADGSVVWRAYSLVSAPHDEHLEFFSIVDTPTDAVRIIDEFYSKYLLKPNF